ncbi:hypothetical protein [Rossellomorea sp. FM04394]|uniref:hypothetical protein n=1 Tax=Rossellomorea sp. FM04394 TaxID=3243076 RepID=UPI0035A63160
MELLIHKDNPLMSELMDIHMVYQSFFSSESIHLPEHRKWLEKLSNFQLSEKNDLNSFHTEKEIDQLVLELRVLWFEHVQRITNHQLKSPPLTNEKLLPSGNRIDFSYERNIQPKILESKAENYKEIPEHWFHDHIMLSSGMAAISTFLQSIFGMIKPSSSQNLIVSTWSEYFETRVLTDLYRRECTAIHNFKDQVEFFKAIPMTDIFFIEPVRYNWELEVFDLNLFVDQLVDHSKEGLKVIVLDTTLNGDSLNISSFLNRIQIVPNVIVVQIHSILKLDQQGLELSNGGLINIYTYKQNKILPSANDLANYIRQVRTILGTGLTYEEIALLDHEFFLNKESFHNYCHSVFNNNAELSESIQTQGLFNKIAHPSKHSSNDWAKAPFVVFHLREDMLENYGFLLAVVNEEVRKNEVNVIYGSSFGFRHHRYEVIIPNTLEGKGLFKVAMGARKGPAMEFLIHLLKKISKYPSISSLKTDYPHLKPVDLINL